MTTVWGLHTPWIVGLVLLLLPFVVGYIVGKRKGKAEEHTRWLLRRRRTRPTTHYGEAYEREVRKERGE